MEPQDQASQETGRKTQKRAYQKISFQERKELIKLMKEDKFSLVQASRKVGIRISTAKMILKKYEETGKIFERKDEKRKRQLTEEIKKELIDVPCNQQQQLLPTNWFYQNQCVQWMPYQHTYHQIL